MSDLVEFLLARLVNDEQYAWEFHRMDCEAIRTTPFPCTCGYEARVLAEVAAKRAIIELHRCIEIEDGLSGDDWDCDHCGQPWLRMTGCPTLRLLALPYASDESYRDEWRPA